MNYDEFKILIIARLKEDIEKANGAGERASNDMQLGIYHGYGKHAREILNLMRDLWVQPEICDDCGAPTVYNPEKIYRKLCGRCAAEELQKVIPKSQP